MVKLPRTVLVMLGVILFASTALAAGETYQGFAVVNVFVDGKPLQSDVPAVNFYGRTVLPLRAVADAAGMGIMWDAASNTAILTSLLTPANAAELQADKTRLSTELVAAKKDAESAKTELTTVKKDLAAAQAEVKRLTTATPAATAPTPVPVVQPPLPPLKTAEEIQTYLQANLASVKTPAGDLKLTFDVSGPNDDNTYAWDYIVSMRWDDILYFSFNLPKLEHSLTAPPGGREESIRILKDHSRQIYEVAAKSLPSKKIKGYFIRTWYDYPSIRVGYNLESHFSWQNYDSKDGIFGELGPGAYVNATLSQFHFTSDDK